jgi:hypothetical protein
MSKKVLITGASGGIGKEFATIYAQRKYDLILVSRDMKTLKKLKMTLGSDHGVSIEICALDLSRLDDVQKLLRCAENQDIDIVINNAGVGLYGEFLENDREKIHAMNRLNMSALVELTHFFAKKMAQKGDGKILNIASTAAFQPIPKFAVYAASKAFVLHFTEALHAELKSKGVIVCALCPGATATRFDQASHATHTKLFRHGVMDARKVAEIGVRQLDRNKMTKVAGRLNTIKAWASDINPFRGLSVRIADYVVN